MNNKIPCGGFYLSDTLGVDENGKLGVNGDEPFKSLVTDGDGGVKWEDRLAYTKTIPGSDGPIITFRAYLNTISPLTLSEPLIVGAPYTVNVGNDKCKTICTTDGEHLSITVSVQGSAQGSLIVNDPINNPLVALWNGAVTNKRIEIVRESQEEVKQIDPKYIPNPNVIVNITGTDGNYTADKTFSEVKALIDSGAEVKCMYDSLLFNCIGFTNEEKTSIGFEFEALALGVASTIVFATDSISVNFINLEKKLLPEVSASDNNKFLSVANGTWRASSNLIVPSSTSGSSKKFKITVDDSGAISATEVTS